MTALPERAPQGEQPEARDEKRDICEEWNAKKWSNEAPMLRGFGDLLAAEIRRLRAPLPEPDDVPSPPAGSPRDEP